MGNNKSFLWIMATIALFALNDRVGIPSPWRELLISILGCLCGIVIIPSVIWGILRKKLPVLIFLGSLICGISIMGIGITQFLEFQGIKPDSLYTIFFLTIGLIGFILIGIGFYVTGKRTNNEEYIKLALDGSSTGIRSLWIVCLVVIVIGSMILFDPASHSYYKKLEIFQRFFGK